MRREEYIRERERKKENRPLRRSIAVGVAGGEERKKGRYYLKKNDSFINPCFHYHMDEQKREIPKPQEVVMHMLRIGADRDQINRAADVIYRLHKARLVLDELLDCDNERKKVINAVEILGKNDDIFNRRQEAIAKYAETVDCEKVQETVEMMREAVYTALENLASVLGEKNANNAMRFIVHTEDLMSAAVDIAFYNLRYAIKQ